LHQLRRDRLRAEELRNHPAADEIPARLSADLSVLRHLQLRQGPEGLFATDHFSAIVSGGIVGPNEAPVLLATVVVIVATLAQIIIMKLRGSKIDMMLWISLGLVVVFGGATIWFHNETFIKWKPSVLYWAMGLSFWVSQTFFAKNLLQAMLGEQLQLPAQAWQRLNVSWIAFFAAMGVLNLFVAYSFSTDTWVNFKLFGGIGLMLLFTVAQGMYMARFVKPEADEAEAANKAP
jgi:intracellular septation protein